MLVKGRGHGETGSLHIRVLYSLVRPFTRRIAGPEFALPQNTASREEADMTATWSAPGRINLIGEHVDYNDGLVLPLALPMKTTASVTRLDNGVVTVRSDHEEQPAKFAVDPEPDDVTGWSAYVAGVVWGVNELLRQRDDGGSQRGAGVISGLDVDLASDVPVGAGLSSSAALECSVACALNDEFDLGLDRREIADLARRAENDFVGVPTGSMDQLASMLCEAGHALFLDCQTMETRLIAFDPSTDDLALLVINTHADHELAGSEYGDRRRACEAAASQLGVESLRDATLGQVATLDDQFLQRLARHVVTEIQRVREVVELLDAGRQRDIGDLLTASHESLRVDYEVSCEELDVTVDAALAAGALGARMTGGGFGGCAIALIRSSDARSVEGSVRAAYDDRGWQAPTIWSASPAQGAARAESDGQPAADS